MFTKITIVTFLTSTCLFAGVYSVDVSKCPFLLTKPEDLVSVDEVMMQFFRPPDEISNVIAPLVIKEIEAEESPDKYYVRYHGQMLGAEKTPWGAVEDLDGNAHVFLVTVYKTVEDGLIPMPPRPIYVLLEWTKQLATVRIQISPHSESY